MKQYINFLTLLLICIIASLASGCSSDEPKDGSDPDVPDVNKVRRTVLVYMIATNNLGTNNFDYDDIREMLDGASAGSIADDSRWLIYHAPAYGYAPRLIEFTSTDTLTLKQYESGGSATYDRIREVLDDMAAMAPADKYGLVLWSHGSGWIANGIEEDLPDEPYAQTLSFGSDNGKRMNISTLRAAVKGRGIDYIYFDVCHMCSVEVVYELRDAVDFIVASPSETPAAGMRYDLNMAPLCDGSKDALIHAADNTFKEYNSMTDLYSRTCTMSVVATNGLERLASATAAIYDLTYLPHPGEKVTNYYGTTRQGDFIDFGEYVNALANAEDVDPRLINEFNAALDQVILYKAATQYLWGQWPIHTASGLSTYVFNEPESFTAKGYDTLHWAIDVVSHHIH